MTIIINGGYFTENNSTGSGSSILVFANQDVQNIHVRVSPSYCRANSGQSSAVGVQFTGKVSHSVIELAGVYEDHGAASGSAAATLFVGGTMDSSTVLLGGSYINNIEGGLAVTMLAISNSSITMSNTSVFTGNSASSDGGALQLQFQGAVSSGSKILIQVRG